MDTITPLIGAAGKLLEAGAVLLILIGVGFATGRYLLHLQTGAEDAFRRYRHGLGRSLLLGIELLIAGDLVRTVALDPTIGSVLVLGGIVLIRTFLSISIEVELEGRWPWQRPPEEQTHDVT